MWRVEEAKALMNFIFGNIKSLGYCKNYGSCKKCNRILAYFTIYRSIFRFGSHKPILFALVQNFQRHIPTAPYVEVEQLIVKYGQQMVIKHRTDGSTDTFLYRTQSDWLNANFQKMGCQKISSTDVEEKIKPVYQIRKRIVRSSVPKFMHCRN